MAINRAQDRFLPLLNGNVLTAGGSLNLAKGQLGIFDTKTSTKNGLAVADFSTPNEKGVYQIRVGNDTSRGDKSKSTMSFRLRDVIDLKVFSPSLKKSVDEVLIGYDGLNEDTALKFEEGDHEELTLVLNGPGVGLQGAHNSEMMFKFYFEKALGSTKTDQEIVEDAVRRMKDTPTMRGQKLTDLVDITTVNSENVALTGVASTYYELALNVDSGSNTLGDIQAQYATKVEKDPSTGKYVMIVPTIAASGVPVPYVETITKAIEDCPDGELEVTTTTVNHLWTAGKECFSKTAKYTLQLADDDCGENYLTELQAQYPDFDVKLATTPAPGACQTVYEATVPTNLVCEECDPMFTDLFMSEAPQSWGIYNWIKEESVYDEAALMGIRIKAKETINIADEFFKDTMPFLDTSVRIKVSGGYATEVSSSYTTGREVFNIKYLSKQEDKENMGGDLWALEDRDNTYFNLFPTFVGASGYEHEMAKRILGQESVIKGGAQYVLFNLTVNIPQNQGNSVATLNQKVNYLIAAEVGKHTAVQTLLNTIATAVGIDTVTAYA